jgi:trk system potassium uptake protein TrkH
MPDADDARTVIGLMPLAILGAIGLPVLIELFNWIFRGLTMSKHSQVVLAATSAMFLLGLIGCYLFLRDANVEPRPALASALIGSVNSRTAGLPIEYVYDYPRAMQWLLVGLMFIGGAPASTAGGLKLTTLVVLLIGMRRTLRNDSSGRAFGIALAWCTIYLLLNFLTMLWLLQSAPEISADRALFITVSAVSNTGLSPDPLSVTAANGYVLSTAMLLGRLLPVCVLWWMAATTRDSEIAIG